MFRDVAHHRREEVSLAGRQALGHISRLLSLWNVRVSVFVTCIPSSSGHIELLIIVHWVDVHFGAAIANVRLWIGRETARSGARLAKETRLRATDILSYAEVRSVVERRFVVQDAQLQERDGEVTLLVGARKLQSSLGNSFSTRVV